MEDDAATEAGLRFSRAVADLDGSAIEPDELQHVPAHRRQVRRPNLNDPDVVLARRELPEDRERAGLERTDVRRLSLGRGSHDPVFDGEVPRYA